MVERNDDLTHGGYRRIEVIADGGRRRRWSDDEKAAIVLESLRPGAVVTEIARRRGVRAQQIHGWRRDAREGRLALPGDEAPLAFASILVESASGEPRLDLPRRRSRSRPVGSSYVYAPARTRALHLLSCVS